MSQFTSLTLKDDGGADLVFANSRIDYSTGVATWLGTGQIFDAKRKATFSLTLPSAKTSRARCKIKVAIPLMDSVDGSKKVDETTFNGEFVLPKNCSLAHRKDILAHAESFITSAFVTAAIEMYEGLY